MVSGELLGREAALGGLQRALREAVAGRGGLRLIVGEAGIGKTALALRMASGAAELGMGVWWATCWDGQGAPPYWPWVQLLRAGAEAGAVGAAALLARLTGDGGPAGLAGGAAATRERFEVFDQIMSVVRGAAVQQPLLLIFDDVQWADVPSLLLLNFVARQVGVRPVLLLGTFRDDEVDVDDPRSAVLGQLRGAGEITALSGLVAQDVERLLGTVAGTSPRPGLVADVMLRTGGNPFFVREVAQVLQSRGELACVDRVEGIPAGVRQVISHRLARLPQACVSILTIAAVVGGESTVDVLAGVSGCDRAEIADVLLPAVRSRVLTTPVPGGPYRFAHDLFREALYGGVSAATRAELHLAVARAIQASRHGIALPAAELAHHLLSAAIGRADDADLADESVLFAGLAAEEAIRRLGYEDAVGHVNRQLVGLDGAGMLRAPSRLALLSIRGEALRCAGDPAARADFRAAVELARELNAVTELGRAALGVHALGVESGASRGDVVELLEEVLDRLPDSDSALKAQVLAALARELFLTGVAERIRAAHLSTTAVEVARRLRDDRVLVRCLLAGHDTIWLPGTAGRRRAIAVEMGAAARRAGDRALEAEACLLRASAGLELGDPVGITDLEEFCQLGEAVGQPRYQYLALTRRVALATMAGRFADAEHHLASAAELAERIGEPDAWNVHTRNLWELRTAQGRRTETETELRGVRLPGLRYWYDALVGLVRLERGDASAAVRLIGAAVQARPEDLAYSYVLVVQWSELGEAAAAVGLTEACQRYYDAMLPYAGTTAITAAAVGFNGAVDHHLGVLAAALGRITDAIAHHTAAMAMHQRLSAWPWVARSYCELAAALTMRGRTADTARAAEVIAAARQLDADFGLPAIRRRAAQITLTHTNVIRREGEGWYLSYLGTDVRLRDVKGLVDIAALIRVQGHTVPATVLVAGGAPIIPRFDADPVLDREAQRQYRDRLGQLDTDLLARQHGRPDDHEAESLDDLAAIVHERAYVARELAAATGLGGRDRRLGDDRERARKAVAARIKDAVDRIAVAHPALAKHLREAISTGNLCAYRPAEPTRWNT